jgi:hypothetical protein
MGIFGDSAGLRLIDDFLIDKSRTGGGQSGARATRRGLARRLAHGFAWLAALELACALCGCAGNDSGALLIDPGRYELFKCDDLATRWRLVSAREKELRALMDRASQTGGGAVVGSLAYRSDYETVLSDERLLARTAAAKNCPLSFQVPGMAPQPVPMQAGPLQAGQGGSQNTIYQSDQGIR